MSDTPIADMVEQMLSGGIPADMVVLAVRTAERATLEATRPRVVTDPAADRRRAWDRHRKKSERSNSGGMSTPVADSALPSTEVVISGTSSKEKEANSSIPVECPPDKPKRAVGQSLPADWKPNEDHGQLAISLGRTVGWMRMQEQAMRDWAIANKHRAVTRKSDWDATFSGWMRREAGRAPIPRGGGSAAPSFLTEAMGGQNGKH